MLENTYGPKFRELRKEQDVTLIKAAKGITSKSSLSLWEQGKDNLSFNQVLKLIKRIHIQPIEFFDYLVSPKLINMSIKIDAAYVASDIATLRKYVIDKAELSQAHPQNQEYFIEYCFACTFYQDLSENKPFTENDQKRLTNILSNISEWNYKNIFYFCNTLGLLDAKTIHRLANSLINYSLNHELEHRRWYDEVLSAVLNSAAILIKRDYHLAESVLNNIEKLPLSDRSAFEKIHIKYDRALIKYIKTKDDQDIKTIIYATKLLNLSTIEDGCVTGFNQIKEIYGQYSLILNQKRRSFRSPFILSNYV